MRSKVDLFVLIISVSLSLLIENRVQELFSYHWALSIVVTIPIVVVLMVAYNFLKKSDEQISDTNKVID